MLTEEEFLKFDKEHEPIKALESAELFLLKSKSDYYYYKWTLIAVHSALQSLMVLALQGTSHLSVIKIKNKDKNKTHYEILSNPENKLVDFLTLFERIRSEEYMRENLYKCDDNAISSITELNRIRNAFIHFLTDSMVIEKLYINQCIKEALLVMEFLINESNNVRYRYLEQELDSFRTTIINIRNALES